MAVPKSKVSKQRRNKRRSSVWKLETPGLTKCPKCGAYRLPHRLCKSCMTYNGREFGKVETTRRLDRAHTAVVAVVHVTDIEARALTRQAAGPINSGFRPNCGQAA